MTFVWICLEISSEWWFLAPPRRLDNAHAQPVQAYYVRTLVFSLTLNRLAAENLYPGALYHDSSTQTSSGVSRSIEDRVRRSPEI